MLTSTQKTQFLREHVVVLSDTRSDPPRHIGFLDATREDLRLYPATLEVHIGQYTMYPDQTQCGQWLGEVLSWLLPLFASETETVEELLERLDPDVLAQHLGYTHSRARIEALGSKLGELADEIGLDADFWLVQSWPKMVLVINNDGIVDGYLVPVEPLWKLFTRAGELAASPGAIWDQVTALARTVRVTVVPTNRLRVSPKIRGSEL